MDTLSKTGLSFSMVSAVFFAVGSITGDLLWSLIGFIFIIPGLVIAIKLWKEDRR